MGEGCGGELGEKAGVVYKLRQFICKPASSMPTSFLKSYFCKLKFLSMLAVENAFSNPPPPCSKQKLKEAARAVCDPRGRLYYTTRLLGMERREG
jgi:hypothetical protein